MQKLYQPVVKPAEIKPQPSQGKDFVGVGSCTEEIPPHLLASCKCLRSFLSLSLFKIYCLNN